MRKRRTKDELRAVIQRVLQLKKEGVKIKDACKQLGLIDVTFYHKKKTNPEWFHEPIGPVPSTQMVLYNAEPKDVTPRRQYQKRTFKTSQPLALVLGDPAMIADFYRRLGEGR